MDPQSSRAAETGTSERGLRLSYKFQRLREKLRAAISSGELSGKLPGERQLAKRFHVNAKTLSKALTDLAAEGLLDRSIGRGTFVRPRGTQADASSEAAWHAATTGERWLAVCDPAQLNCGLLQHLRQVNPNLQIVTDTSSLRPSFLSPMRAVIDLSPRTPDAFIRDLIVRGIAVVIVDREPSTYSVNAVLIDRALAAAHLSRDLMLLGHRRFLTVERRGQTCLADAIRRTAQRVAPDVTVDGAFAGDALAAVQNNGITAIVCDSSAAAAQVRDELTRHNIDVPGHVSLAAVGSGQPGDCPCSGYFISEQQEAQTVAQVLRESQLRRPTTLWLTGQFVDAGTMAPPARVFLPSDRDQPGAQVQPHAAQVRLSGAPA
jgi:DNA-binding transcriptional regulator YhcF (GntR family)